MDVDFLCASLHCTSGNKNNEGLNIAVKFQ